MDLRRCLETSISVDLNEKMVFVAGPRQVGKTTLARHVLASSGPGVYLNWDNRDDRREIRAARWPAGKALLVFEQRIYNFRFRILDFGLKIVYSAIPARRSIGVGRTFQL